MTASTTPAAPQAHPSARHSWLDNLQGLVFGVVMLAFGNALLKAAGLITGQLAGLSLLGAQITGQPFGLLFLLVNLPFYVFAVRVRGWAFALRSLVAVALVGFLADHAGQWVSYDHLHPVLAAVVGGFSSGIGMIALFRHGASCGGMGIVSMYVQDRTGFRAGWLQLLFDLALLACALAVMPARAVLLSVLGGLVMNLSIAFNHRRDWYTAT
jgi:uncharacterized membrane-anchored protein YitT (DUF2179 family)